MDKKMSVILPKPQFETKIINKNNKLKRGFATPFGMNYKNRKLPSYKPSSENPVSSDSEQIKSIEEKIKIEFCDVCEMELAPGEQLTVHCSEHISCPIEGCNFSCHSDVLENHVGIVHAAGLYDKVKKLSTPEDLAKWREERRKRFPSTANVEMRRKAEEQRKKRGERLVNKKRGFRSKDYKDPRGANEKSNNKRKFSRDRRKSKKIKTETNNLNAQTKHKEKLPLQDKQNQIECQKRIDTMDSESMQGGIIMFKGTSSLDNYATNDKVVRQVITKSDALSNIFGAYGSDDDSFNSNEEQSDDFELPSKKNEIEKNTVKANKNSNNNEKLDIDSNLINNELPSEQTNIETKDSVKPTNSTTYNKLDTKLVDNNINEIGNDDDDDDDGPEEVPIKKNCDFVSPRLDLLEAAMLENNNEKSSKPGNDIKSIQKPKFKRKSGLNYKKMNSNKYPTMLGLLLENEIRHERNVLLQCVRFVCENNFFINKE